MPRGKKARTDEVDKKASKSKSEPVVEEVKKKETTLAEITTYLKEQAGKLDSINGLKDLLLNSSLTRKLVNSVMAAVFEEIEAAPEHLNWGKACIQLITHDVMDPKTRIKEAFFFPNAESEKRLIRYLNRAEKTMLVCVFTLTNDDLVNALRRAKARGVEVRIISDDELMRMNGSDVKLLHNEGFEVRVDLDSHAQMHNKFCVIDDYIIITGSFNWTKQAVNMNQENLVVMDDPVLARTYTEQFNKMWQEFAGSVDKYLGGAKAPGPVEAVKAPEVLSPEKAPAVVDVFKAPEVASPPKSPAVKPQSSPAKLFSSADLHSIDHERHPMAKSPAHPASPVKASPSEHPAVPLEEPSHAPDQN